MSTDHISQKYLYHYTSVAEEMVTWSAVCLPSVSPVQKYMRAMTFGNGKCDLVNESFSSEPFFPDTTVT